MASPFQKSWHPLLRRKILAALGITERSFCQLVFRPWTAARFSNSIYSVLLGVPLLTLISLFCLRLRLPRFGPAPSPLPLQQESAVRARRGLERPWHGSVHSIPLQLFTGAAACCLPLTQPLSFTLLLNKTCSHLTTQKGLTT